MDPTAALERYILALVDNDYAEANDAFNDLLGWLVNGGFAPRMPENCEIHIEGDEVVVVYNADSADFRCNQFNLGTPRGRNIEQLFKWTL